MACAAGSLGLRRNRRRRQTNTRLLQRAFAIVGKRHRHRLTRPRGRQVAEQPHQIVGAHHAMAAKLRDDIAGSQTGCGGRRVGVDLGDQRAMSIRQAERLAQRLADRLRIHPSQLRST